MPLTLRDVLALEVFRQAEAEVVAGASQLDRNVRWVHVSELPDISPLLRGDELLLSTGLGLGTSPEAQKRYIRDLAEVGVTGVAIELGRTFKEFPPSMVAEAERVELPLIALRRETRFVDITEQVHSSIINRQYELLRKAERIRQEMTGLVLRGASLRRIIHHLASIVENPVVLEDTAHQVVEFASHAGPIEEMLEAWEVHSRTGHTTGTGEVQTAVGPEGVTCVWMPIILRDEELGRLHVLEIGKRLDEIDSLALDRAGAAVSLALFGDRDAAHLSDRARHALMSDILEGRYESLEEVLSRARTLGADVRDKRLFFLVVELPDMRDLAGAKERSERDRQKVQSAALREIEGAVTEAGSTCLCTLQGDRVLAILGVPKSDDPRQTLDQIGEAASARIATYGGKAVMGLSARADLDSFPRALEQAKQAVRYGSLSGDPSRPHHYGDLGLQQLLLSLAEGPELARFIESELHPLLEHDAKSSVPLIPVLRTYLESGTSKSDTARRLHVERRTVYRRLEKISRLLGRDLGGVETQTRLLVAIRGLDLLRHRQATHASEAW